METMDYGGFDDTFLKLQEEMDLRMAKKSGAAKGKGRKKKSYVPSKGFTSKYFRGLIFNDSAKKMKPDRSLLEQYKNYLTDEYAIALKKQLKISGRGQVNGKRQRWSNLGYATGNLRKSIKVSTRLIIEHNAKAGRYFIDYEMTPEYLDYGNYIANGRTAGAIPEAMLIKWIEDKIRLGSLRIYKVRRDKARPTGKAMQNRKVEIKRIANAISWAASKASKPAVLKDWPSWTDNPNLREEFWKATKKRGAFYRRKIRASIVKNLSIDYGKIK